MATHKEILAAMGFDPTAAAALVTPQGMPVIVVTDLTEAFDWEASPQGYQFWENEHDLASQSDEYEISANAKAILRDWLAEALGFVPAGQAIAQVVDAIPEPKADPLPARALQLPQMMGGGGAWDNLRYAATEDDVD